MRKILSLFPLLILMFCLSSCSFLGGDGNGTNRNVPEETVVKVDKIQYVWDTSLGGYEARMLDLDYSQTKVEFPSEINGYPLVSIGSSMFLNDDVVKEVVIPDSVTTLRRACFKKTEIETITIGSGIKEIGNEAFAGSNRLESVTINGNLEDMGDHTFDGCFNLKNLTITGDKLKNIGSSSFYGCLSLRRMDIPQTYTYIGYDAFCGCGLLQLVIPSCVTTIKERSFNSCGSMEVINLSSVTDESLFQEVGHYSTSLSDTAIKEEDGFVTMRMNGLNYLVEVNKEITDVVIPSDVDYIRQDVFDYPLSVKSLVVPNTISGYEYYFLSELTNLESLTLPYISCGYLDNKDNEEDSTFGLRYMFTGDFTVPETLKYVRITDRDFISSNAFSETNIETIVYDQPIKRILSSAFQYATVPEGILVNNPIEEIGDRAFEKSTLSGDLVLPNTVKSIGNYAFSETSITSFDVEENSVLNSVGKVRLNTART